jgi:hypothetical protein
MRCGYPFRLIAFLALSLSAFGLHAEQSQDFGDYVVHFNAIGTDLLPPKVAKEYGIRRSNQRAMLNIAVQKKKLGTSVQPVAAKVTASAVNLAGQAKDIRLREIREPYAIYYIGEFSVSNEETLKFSVDVIPEGSSDSLTVKFRQQFFTP